MIFAGNFVISVKNTKEYLEIESTTKAQDTATSLGMRLKPFMKDKSDPEIISIINAIAHRGFYKEIRLEDAFYTFDDKTLILENKDLDGLEWVISDVKIDTSVAYGVIDTLYHTIQERKTADPKTSWTAKLLQGEENSLLKKIVEEAGEFTFAIKDNDEQEIIYEAADIAYHVLVAMASKNISPDRVKQELARRFGISGIAEKDSRTK